MIVGVDLTTTYIHAQSKRMPVNKHDLGTVDDDLVQCGAHLLFWALAMDLDKIATLVLFTTGL